MNPSPAHNHSPRVWVAVAALAALTAMGGGLSLVARGARVAAQRADAPTAAPAPELLPEPGPPPERTRSLSHLVGRNRNPTQVLAGLGFEGAELHAVLAAFDGVLDFRRTRPGDQVRVERSAPEGALRSLSWRQGPADEFLVVPCATGLCAGRRVVSVTRQTVRVSVNIRTSVSEAIQLAGHDVGLVAASADVLAWDVDFYQDVRPGDALKVVVERF